MSDAAASASAPADGKAKVNKKELKAAQKAAKGGGDAPGAGAGAARSADAPLPEWLVERARKWDEIVAKRAAEAKQSSPTPIKVTLPNGKVMDATSESTPLDICRQISNSLEKKVVAGKVTFEGAEPAMWDLGRALGKDCKLELLEFDSPDGKKVFWHSSAHVLGQAIEREFHEAKLCIGPAVEEGFYYDVYLGSERKVRPDDYANLESFIDKITKEKQPFTRLELKKEEALEMFKDNQFKQEILKNKVPDGATCTAYRCGPLIDLCKGPHVPNTGVIKALSVIKHSASYWLAKSDRESLQRVYGISFPDKAALKEYKEMLKKAEERDHRKIGLEQKLFFFHELSPGSCFFMPHGARLYNTLINFIKSEYVKRGYREVVTPNIYNVDLWKTSGHWQHYAENMYSFKIEDAEFALKPMNCPGHCLMFRQNLRSYRELPLRLADFGVLHRNEISGALSGLTRVRRFQQDDAHIFCTHAQIEEEVRGVLDFMQYVYRIFGFKFTLMLSTRPEKYLGEIEVWNKAEKALENSLTQVFGKEWSVNPGDGAFYGPKIDIQLTDALNRKHQCATIQLDFQLPIRFGLEYNAGGDIHEHEHHQHEQHDEKDKEAAKAAKKEHAKAKKEAAKANKGDWEKKDGAKPAEKKEGELTDGFERPVMIHRAILGSVERMIAVLTEHTGGKWPFWLSPRQAIVVPIGEKYFEYATQVRDLLVSGGFHAEADVSNSQFKKKVRDGQIEQYNFILVVGEKEQANKTVNVRQRDKEGHAEEAIPLSQLLEMFQQLKNNYQ